MRSRGFNCNFNRIRFDENEFKIYNSLYQRRRPAPTIKKS